MNKIIFFALNFLLFFTYFIAVATDREEEISNIKKKDVLVVSNDKIEILNLKKFQIDSEQDIFEKWIKKINKKNNLDLISSPDRSFYSLIFKSVDNISFLSHFPIFNSIFVSINISYRDLSLRELKQAVKLAQENPSLIYFKIKPFHEWNSKEENVLAQKRFLKAYTSYNGLIGGKTDFSYNFGKNDPDEYNIILKGLKNAPSLKKIDLKFLRRESVNALEIIETLGVSHFIEEIYLLYIGRPETLEEIRGLADLVSISNSLRYLKLDMAVNDAILRNFSAVLGKETIFLKKLEIISNQTTPISKETLKAFFQSIGMNQSLETLILKWNFSISGGIWDLSEALKSNNTLKILILDGCHIGDRGISSLSTRLEENKSITKLGLSDNGITDEGANAILRALDKNSTLHYISLGSDYRSLVDTGSSSSSSDYLNSIDFFNRISSIKRKEIQQILRERQEFDLSAEHCVTPTKSMIPVSDIDPHTELSLDASEDSSSSSSSSAIPDSHMGPDDIP